MSVFISTGCGMAGEEEARRLAVTGDTLAVIGALDGPDHEVFGRLIAVGAHGDHGLFLLDLQRGAIFWYGFDGGFHDALLQRGEGPGDLATPWDVHIDQEGLWVLDRGNSRISQFALRDGDGMRYVRSRPGEFPDGSICRLGERMLLGGLGNGYTLHELDGEGEITHSMGPAPEIAGAAGFGGWLPLVESQLLRGRVYCAYDEGMVVVALSAHPLVRAFDEGGVLRWETELTGIHSIRFFVTAGGSLESEPDPETGAHFLRSMIPWSEGTLLLQYEIRIPGEPPDDQGFHGIDSRLIDLGSGEELARSQDLPLIHARAGNYLVLVDNLPYPRVTVLELREME
jgi:hypothetical protein